MSRIHRTQFIDFLLPFSWERGGKGKPKIPDPGSCAIGSTRTLILICSSHLCLCTQHLIHRSAPTTILLDPDALSLPEG